MMQRNVRPRRVLAAGLTMAFASTLVSLEADAHFRLASPANWVVQDPLGSPQKTGPCGNEGPETPSNVTTAFRPGDTVTIQIDETIFHPGHYRVALAVNSPSELPPDPLVTAGASQCGSAVIQQTPTFPVLADGVLQHTKAFPGPQSFQVKLPTNVTCTSCTLQIVEFMSDHAAPCFYYHCANIAIQSAAADAGSDASDASTDGSRDAVAEGGPGGAGGTAGGGGIGGATADSGGPGGRGGAGGTAGIGGSASGGTAGTTAGRGGSSGAAGASGFGGAAGVATDGGPGAHDAIDTDDGGCACSAARRTGSSMTGPTTLLASWLGARRRRRRGKSA